MTQLITRKELLQKLRISEPTCIRLEKKGIIPAIKLNGKMLYDEYEIEKLINTLKKERSPKLIDYLKAVNE